MINQLKLHFHADCDGITSAYFVSNELKRLGVKHTLHPSLGANVELLGDGNISLDLSNAQGKGWNLSIDHHVAERPPFFYANPRNAGFEWPVSFTTYALFGSKEKAWIAAIGVVADWCAERVPSKFWEVVFEQWPELKQEINQKKMVKGKLGQMALLIDSAVAAERAKGALKALRVLRDAEDYKEFSKNKELKELKKLIDKEVNSAFKGEIVTKKYALLKFSSKYRIKSLIAAKLKEKWEDRMVIIAQEERDKIRLSFRNGNNLNQLVKELTQNIGDGGGHPQASGGWVHKKDWQIFLGRLEGM